jgi:hypothetical protein
MAQDIRTYDGLVAAVQAWLDDAGDSLTDNIPNMIALAEADFRRNIVTPDMEATVTIDPFNPALPADVDSIRSLAIVGAPSWPLEQLGFNEFYALPAPVAGQPQYYATSNQNLYVWPSPDAAYTINLVYRQAIPAITPDNETNWLLTKHPDAYLFGTLLQAEFFGWTDSRLPIIQAKLASIIDDINKAGNRARYGGPIVMRANVYDGLGVRA